MSNARQIKDLPIIGYYDIQRFKQYNGSDCANWTLQPNELGKKKVAMYPALGRQHIHQFGRNQLNFEAEPRFCDKSVTYSYYVVANKIYRIDRFFNKIEITNGALKTVTGQIDFDYLVVGNITFVCFTDSQALYVYVEPTMGAPSLSGTFNVITSTTTANFPANPIRVIAFGNRIAVASLHSSVFNLSEIGLQGASFTIATCFTIAGLAVFASEVGEIQGFAVLQNTLYIFTPFTTGIWSDYPSSIAGDDAAIVPFPWKKNTSIEWAYGLADYATLDVAFNMIGFVGLNEKGLRQAVVSLAGSSPKPINSKAIDVLFQKAENLTTQSPFIAGALTGFFYEYENSIYYRLSAGDYTNSFSKSIEYNFDAEKWSRAIEVDGNRAREQLHIFFGNRNLVTVAGDTTVYEFSGAIYHKEIRNPDVENVQDPQAYLAQPMRYIKTTPNITIRNLNDSDPSYAQFQTDYVEIDFAWGLEPAQLLNAPFPDAVFIVDESVDTLGKPIFLTTENADNELIIAEQGNTPQLSSQHYFNWYRPHIELLYSDDGSVTFQSADVLQFSDLGNYEWRMRWDGLGTSRNRAYYLLIVSFAPIVVLGGNMMMMRVSGGAN